MCRHGLLEGLRRLHTKPAEELGWDQKGGSMFNRPITDTPLRWYAVRVKSNRENVVASSLEGKDLDCFLPTYIARRQWSDRVVDTEIPLFRGYVFCFLNAAERLPVLTIPGVIDLVGIGKTPH